MSSNEIDGQGPPPMPGAGGSGGGRSATCGCLFVALVFIGILAAIAIPDFLQFGARAKQAEPKANLSALFTAQIQYFNQHDAYAHTFEQLRWSPEGDTKYSYYLADDALLATNPGKGPYDCPDQFKPYSTDESYLMIAVGNIDYDQILDVWTMDDNKNLRNVRDDLSIGP